MLIVPGLCVILAWPLAAQMHPPVRLRSCRFIIGRES
jgi:hypothetical protein